MSLNIYDFTIPTLINTLTALSAILTKASSTSSSSDSLPSTRLISDMLPLTFQVQTACNTAKFIPVRVAGHNNLEMPDDETTFDQLITRISKTIDYLQSVSREEFEGKEKAEVQFRDFKFTGLGYVTKFAMPNFFFHVTMAYAILRKEGVEIGKMDYLGKVKGEVIE